MTLRRGRRAVPMTSLITILHVSCRGRGVGRDHARLSRRKATHIVPWGSHSRPSLSAQCGKSSSSSAMLLAKWLDSIILNMELKKKLRLII